MILREDIEVQTDGSGGATAYSGGPVVGEILEVRAAGAAFAAATTDITVTRGEAGGNVVAVANTAGDWSRAPRQPTHGQDGSASLYAAGGEPVEDHIPAAEDLVVTVAQGTPSETGIVHIYYRA